MAQQQQGPTSVWGVIGQRVMRLLGEDGSSLMGIWGIICLVYLAITGISIVVQQSLGVDYFVDLLALAQNLDSSSAQLQIEQFTRRYEQQSQQSSMWSSIPLYALSILLWSMLFAGMRPMWLIEGEERGRIDFGTARRAMFEHILTAMFTVFCYFLVYSLGLCCCVLPGFFAAFAFLPAPYIAATHGYGASESMRIGYDWMKRHWPLLMAAVVAYLCVYFVVAFGSMMVIPALAPVLGDKAIMVGNLAVWLVFCLMGYIAWIITGAIMVTINRAEKRY